MDPQRRDLPAVPEHTIKGVAGHFGVSYHTVWRMVSSCQIHAVRIGGEWRISAEEVGDYLRRQSNHNRRETQ